MTTRPDIPESRTALDGVRERIRNHETFRKLVEQIAPAAPGSRVAVTGLRGSATAFLVDSLSAESNARLLVVTQRSEGANDIFEDLAAMRCDGLYHYPTRQILPFDFRAPVGEVMGKRISCLAALARGEAKIVVAPVRALLEPTIPRQLLADSLIDLVVGQECDMDDLTERLARLGFNRVSVVEEVGDFARRGGLIDFFTPGAEAPVRVEFYGDEIETVRTFDVATQRTVERLDRVKVLPRREIPVTQESLEKYLDLLPDDDGDYIRRRYVNDPELPGLEWLSLLFDLPQGRLFEYICDDTLLILDGEGAMAQEAEDALEEARGLRSRISSRLTRLPEAERYYLSAEDLADHLGQHAGVDQLPFKGGRAAALSFDCAEHPSVGSRLDVLADTLSQFKQEGLAHFIATDSSGQAGRMVELIADKTPLDDAPPVQVVDLKGGFVCRNGGFAVLTDHEIFGRYHRRVRRKKFKEGVAIGDYSTLTRGDYVVHTDHGIARYLGLETLTVDERSRDCLLLQYAEKDRLYVPIEEFNRVSKYAGKDTAPSLTRLGGPGWDKLKKKTKKAVEAMAADLIRLYAERRAREGFSFNEDSVWQKQLEASFPFDETRDQLKAIHDVKRDMLRTEPMDRLICGDVGYGKTEVAIRAAFKAIDAGKQTAVLVPTTILAQQHFSTFSERFREFPVQVDMLSRFRTRKEQLATVERLATGQADLVIGTHRLLSKDIAFADLGLLIVDEEHRFGVGHKEKLRKLRATVDTITMTATPIPRTLNMALMGARDMSLISTSPKDRLPIATEVVEFDPAIIAAAILREVDRGGQIFFVHNRVQTIDAMHRFLTKLLPQVEIAVAHGQMHERSLEGIMLAFLNGRFDVLLCTSIIESGLDIPNANTLIVNRADRFGLAQLYQIRGRVGRSSRRAFAYLVTPQTKLMTADSIKRLRALEAHSDLGAGFALAMRDLEIRGAGTVLGARQSGFIEEVGFDMYNRLLEEAVAELKGAPIQRLPDTRLELDAELLLPDRYVNDHHQKVDIYRRVADCRNLDDVERIRDEVTDRFGRPPHSAVNLFDAAAIRVCSGMLDLAKLTLRNGAANLFYRHEGALTRSTVEALRKATEQPIEFSLLELPRISIDLSGIEEPDRLRQLKNIMVKIV